MTQLTKEILDKLSAPFSADSVSIKIQTKPNSNGNSLCVAYIDARDVMQRLDDIAAGNWSDDYRTAPSGGLECALTIFGVTRRDVGSTDNENEPEKSAYSDAFKRAAVKFGVGRFLYFLPSLYAKVKDMGKYIVFESGEEERLRKVLTAHLSGKRAKSDPLPKSDNKNQDQSPKSEHPKSSQSVLETITPNYLIESGLFDNMKSAVDALNKTKLGGKLSTPENIEILKTIAP